MVTFSSLLVHPLATCFYGVVGGGLVSFGLMKWQMKKQAQECNVKIVYNVQGPIDIGRGLTSLFPNVQLMYNDTKIDFKIQYITGTIKNMDEKKTVKTLNLPFELILPDDCVILESKILESPKQEIKLENKGNIVEISTPETFLPQEEINYCILYKSPDIVESGIKLKTRIADVDVMSTAEIFAEEFKSYYYSRRIKFIGRFSAWVAMVLATALILLFNQLPYRTLEILSYILFCCTLIALFTGLYIHLKERIK